MAEEPRSFEVFFASEHARLFGALCLVTGDRSEAEEVMQDAFLRLWERWDHVAEVDDPSGYLYRTAMNVFRNRYRRAALALRRTISIAPSEDALPNYFDDALSKSLETGPQVPSTASKIKQNSLPSGSAICRHEKPCSAKSSIASLRPPSASILVCARSTSATSISKCSRFFTVFPSGTRWNETMTSSPEATRPT
jgi:hypothetical protein